MKKLVRITTVPISLEKLLEGQLGYMKKHYKVIAVSSEAEKMESLSTREQVQTFTVDFTRKITPLKDLKALLKLYKFFKREKPFIVHTHTPKAGTIGMLAAKLAGVPHRLHTVAGLPLLEAQGAKRLLLDTVEKTTYGCASKVYPNSFGLSNIIEENGYTKPEKLKVIGNGSSNGIDTRYFDPEMFDDNQRRELRSDHHIGADDLVFIFVGRLVKDKGINELIVAFDLLYKGHPHIKLLLVGSKENDLDPLLPETEVMIDTHEGIIAVGFKQDVRPYFSMADVLAFPTYREGFPNVVMQAGAMGLPSIVTDINGCNEIIKDGVNGVIIQPKNEEQLLMAMQLMIQDPTKRGYMKTHCRPMIEKNYQRSVIWKALLEEYKALENV